MGKKDTMYYVRTILVMLVFYAVIMMFRLGMLPLFTHIGTFLIPLSDFFVILGAGFCGYRFGLAIFLAVFFTEMFFSPQGMLSLFPLFLYMVLVLTSGFFTTRRAFADIRKTILAGVILELELATIFYLVIVVITKMFSLSPFMTLLYTCPEVILSCMILYLYYNFAPDSVKILIGKGYLYTRNYRKEEKERNITLNRRITVLSIIEGIIFGLVIPVFTDIKTGVNGQTDLTYGLSEFELNTSIFLLSLTISIAITVIVNEFIISMVLSVQEAQYRLETDLRVEKARSDAKSSFLANMSHEIRTPINAVLGMNEMILRESSEEEIIGYAENIRSSGNTLLGLINDILDFSKIEAGKMEIIETDYQLSVLLNDLVNMISVKAKDKRLELIVDVNSGIPDYLHGDEVRIKQIATNVLTNAVKYTNEGSVTLKVDYAYVGKDINLKFSITDTGIGIKNEDIPKLFTAFDRIEEERNRSIEGTGLGMNITGKLLTMMGSTMEVISTYGKGSTFSFDIKQGVIDSRPIGNYEEAFRTSVAKRKRYRESFRAKDANVLIVDDTPMNLLVFRNLLKKTAVNIETAESGNECIEKTKSRIYDIIFLDHKMPDKDGIETLNDIRRDRDNPNSATPVVCLTANAISGAREKYISAGFNDYLTKPIDSSQLEKMMIEFLPKEKVVLTDGDAENSDDKKDAAGEEMLRIFLEGLDDRIAVIRKYFDDKDYANYTVKVHALKSSARMVMEIELSEFAERLELAGENNDKFFIEENNVRLMDMLSAVREKYRYVMNPPKDFKERDNSAPVMSDSDFSDAVEALKVCAEDLDIDGMNMLFMELDKYSLNKDQNNLIEEVRAGVRRVDWDSVNALLG